MFNNKSFIIHNKPIEADRYEFIIAQKLTDGSFDFIAYAENGFTAEKIASANENSVIFHNVGIQHKI